MIAGVEQPLAGLGGHLLRNHPGVGGAAGEQHVDRHRGVGQVGRHHPRHRLDRRPRRAVRRVAPPHHRGLAHRDRDDAATALLQHQRHDGARREETAGHLGLEYVAEAVRCHLPEGLRVRQEAGVDGAHPDARVVDEQVDALEALPCLRHPRGDGTLVADVERQAEGVRAQVGGDAIGSLRIPARDHNASARVRKRPGHRQPEAAGGAGDQRAGAAQLGHAPRTLATAPPASRLIA